MDSAAVASGYFLSVVVVADLVLAPVRYATAAVVIRSAAAVVFLTTATAVAVVVFPPTATTTPRSHLQSRHQRDRKPDEPADFLLKRRTRLIKSLHRRTG